MLVALKRHLVEERIPRRARAGDDRPRRQSSSVGQDRLRRCGRGEPLPEFNRAAVLAQHSGGILGQPREAPAELG